MLSFYNYYLSNKNSNCLQSTKWIPYLKLYDEYTNKFINKKSKILEIGVRHGGSLECYSKIFKNAEIYGIDINPECKTLKEKYNFNIFIGSQDDDVFLKGIQDTVNNLDIIIDDGSHIYNHIYKSFNYLFPLLNDGGIYVIEDLHKGPIDFNKLLNKDIDEIILYDQICFIKKSINGKQKITNKYGVLKYSEKDRIHIGNIKLKNF